MRGECERAPERAAKGAPCMDSSMRSAQGPEHSERTLILSNQKCRTELSIDRHSDVSALGENLRDGCYMYGKVMIGRN